MCILKRLILMIFFLGAIQCFLQAVIGDRLSPIVGQAYREAIYDLAARFGAHESCNWEEHVVNIHEKYKEEQCQVPDSMHQWVRQLRMLAHELGNMLLFEHMPAAEEISNIFPVNDQHDDQHIVRFCCMLAAAMLFKKSYDSYMTALKENSELPSHFQNHLEQCFDIFKKIHGCPMYREIIDPMTTYYYAVYNKTLQASPTYYTSYEYLDCYSIGFMLEVLVKAYYHWTIMEQREVMGLGHEGFNPDSDQDFNQSCIFVQSQADVREVGININAQLTCCYKVSKTLKLIAQDHSFEEALWRDIKKRISDFNGDGFVYSPVILAGLAASHEDTANFLASCVLQSFDKMHSHFIYLIFSNPFTCIKQEALRAFAYHFKKAIDEGLKNDWIHQQAEAEAWNVIASSFEKD